MQNAYDNVGKPWSKEETSQLIQSYKHTNKDVFELAAQHGRLHGGTRRRDRTLMACPGLLEVLRGGHGLLSAQRGRPQGGSQQYWPSGQ